MNDCFNSVYLVCWRKNLIRMRFCWLLLVLMLPQAWAGDGRYFALQPDFVVNYGNGADDRIRFMKVNVVLRVRNAADTVELTVHNDYIRHVVTTALSRQTVATIHSAQAQQQLRDELLSAIQDVLEKEVGSTVIDQVLFTDYVIQS